MKLREGDTAKQIVTDNPHGSDAFARVLEREDVVQPQFVRVGYAAASAAGSLMSRTPTTRGFAELADALRRAAEDPKATSALARVLRLSGREARRWLRDTAGLLDKPSAIETKLLVERLRAIRWAWGPLPLATRAPH
jgi:hypothetical protein